MSAPATHAQPSRKGKKAWRKNVNLDPVTSGLEAARDQYTQTGGHLLTDAEASSLFQADTAGDVDIHKQSRSTKHAPLKADQILGARSKVPAVSSHVKSLGDFAESGQKRKRTDKISYHELDRLRRLAYTSDAQRTHLDAPTSTAHDPWADVAPPPQDPNATFLDTTHPIREPSSLRLPPTSLTASGRPIPHVRRPDAGRSYNPVFRDWAALLEKEGAKAVAIEKKRLALEAADDEREARTLLAAAEAEKQEEEQGRAGFSDYESEWEGFQSEAEGADAAMLRAKRPTRKTPAERNKIEKRKKAEALLRHQEKARKRDAQEKQLGAIVRAAKAENRSQALQDWDGFASELSDDERDREEGAMPRRPRFGKRFVPPEAPLELVLPDELRDSLRLLRPEGNLLKERYRNAIVQGRVEARRPVAARAARNKKATEKWTYKDWKLPSQMSKT